MASYGEPFQRRFFTETSVLIGGAVVESLQKYSLQPWANDHFAFVSHNPVLNYAAYNTGDIGNAYAIAAGTDLLLSIFAKNTFSRGTRRWMSAVPSVGAVLLAELVHTPGNILGSPDVNDIPFGLLGTAAYIGFSYWANRPLRQDHIRPHRRQR